MKRLLLIRHAERPIIPDQEVGNDVVLTQQGVQDSVKFGAHLSEPIISINSSPIERCVQTARIIADVKGYPEEHIVTCRDLGDPGFVIEDGSVAWSHWQEKGHEAVNQYLLSGKERWSGFSDLPLAVSAFREKIRTKLLDSPDGIHVWVTHDTILAAFASRVLTKSLSLNEWPYFLDYLEVSMNHTEDLMYSYSRWNRSAGCE
tara:strand:- start:19398 stop:20006 length:609 start_codon:yes stop_codon:yes gene_type:complete